MTEILNTIQIVESDNTIKHRNLPFKEGDIYHHFTLTGKWEFRYSKGVRYVECICSCGEIRWVSMLSLKMGTSKSCGCKRQELSNEKKKWLWVTYKSGERYNFLTLTGKGFKETKTMVEAICDCGTVTWVSLSNIKNGHTKSCGCYRRDIVTTHGMNPSSGAHPIYTAYRSMIDRCANPNIEAFENYGARGILVCEEWLNSFESFKNWSLNNGWAEGLTIDRINNDGNYEPSNCRWTTHMIQNRNRRGNNYIEAFGEKKILPDWALDNRCVVPMACLRSRLRKGVNPEIALTTIKMR